MSSGEIHLFKKLEKGLKVLCFNLKWYAKKFL